MGRWTVAVAILVALAPPVQARPPHPAPPSLTTGDETQRNDAIQRLNDRNPVMLGMSERWESETAEGRVRLDRIYRDRGLECHLLTDTFRSGGRHGRWRTTHPVWCRPPDGAWRLRG